VFSAFFNLRLKAISRCSEVHRSTSVHHGFQCGKETLFRPIFNWSFCLLYTRQF
jgi:hypothetical protein